MPGGAGGSVLLKRKAHDGCEFNLTLSPIDMVDLNKRRILKLLLGSGAVASGLWGLVVFQNRGWTVAAWIHHAKGAG